MTLKMTSCPSCDGGKRSKDYLCQACWFGLSITTRRRLWRKDVDAMARLHQLYEQIQSGVALPEIEVEE